MRKKKRRGWLIAGMAVIFILAVSAILLSQTNREKRITDFVASNEKELKAIALDCLSGKERAEDYRGVEVEGVFPGEHPIVQFYYSGKGLVPSATYYGFYYSTDNTPVSYQNSNVVLTAASDSAWTWDDGTDNGGLTKRIMDCWFYYEAWF